MRRLGRAVARLVPAGRREWAEAIWAEAGEVPPGLRRLAWLAGGARAMAGDALTARAIGRWLLFAAAAAGAAWAAWPDLPGGVRRRGRQDGRDHHRGPAGRAAVANAPDPRAGRR